VKGLIFDIKHYAIHDGPGIRTTIFLKGCPMTCWWCHNPESQEMKPETVEKIRKIGDKKIIRQEISGKWMGIDEVLEIIEKDRVYYDESGGGVTLSGGEPMMQFEFSEELLTQCNKRNIHTALDTCGISSKENFEKILDKVDLFLYDLKLIDEAASKKYTGVGSRIVLENLRFIAERGKHIHIRFPLITGITDTTENIEAMKSYLLAIPGIKRMDILPFHNIAKSKYHRFHKEYFLYNTPEPTKEQVKSIKKTFENIGLDVGIGG
jgi:pyruvate formate lyase activating enzyme